MRRWRDGEVGGGEVRRWGGRGGEVGRWGEKVRRWGGGEVVGRILEELGVGKLI